MVSELFHTSEQLVSSQKQDTGKETRVSPTKIQQNGSSNRTGPNRMGGHSTIQTMKVRAESGPSSCTQHAAHRDCPILPTDTACLATQNAPANRPDPMQMVS